MIGRFPILDVSPSVEFGGDQVGVKAIPDELIKVSATIIREGHEGFSASVLLIDPKGKVTSNNSMKELWPGSYRFEGEIRPTSTGDWTFQIEVRADNPGEFSKELISKSLRYPITVERERSLVGSWYEFFPRSEGAIRNSDGSISSGTFKSAAKRIPEVAEMGLS